MTVGFGALIDKKTRVKIIENAIITLEELGIECSHEKTTELLSQKEGILYNTGRLHFSKDIISMHLEERRKEKATHDTGFKLLGPWCSFEICDPYTNEVRIPEEKEVINATKLIDAITEGTGAFGGCIPLYIQGVHPRLATFKAEETAVKYTRKLGGKLTALDKTEIEFISNMYKAAGRRYKLALQGLISPLRLNPEIMDIFYEYDCNSEIDIEISCTIPMAGATAPVVFPAGLIQSVAEALAVDFIFNTLSTRKLDILTVRLEPFDMKSNNIVFGSPEWCILNRAVVELENELRGFPRRYGVFRSNSKRVDAQSMCERSMTVLFQALNGIRRFGAVGQLCVDEVFSPLQAVLDIQILKYVQRVINGLNSSWNDEIDFLTILREGIADGMFMGHETTREYFRKFYSMDNLFTYNNLNSWREGGMKNLEDAAREELKFIIDNHDFQLDTSKMDEVQRISNEGERYLKRKYNL